MELLTSGRFVPRGRGCFAGSRFVLLRQTVPARLGSLRRFIRLHPLDGPFLDGGKVHHLSGRGLHAGDRGLLVLRQGLNRGLLILGRSVFPSSGSALVPGRGLFSGSGPLRRGGGRLVLGDLFRCRVRHDFRRSLCRGGLRLYQGRLPRRGRSGLDGFCIPRLGGLVHFPVIGNMVVVRQSKTSFSRNRKSQPHGWPVRIIASFRIFIYENAACSPVERNLQSCKRTLDIVEICNNTAIIVSLKGEVKMGG